MVNALVIVKFLITIQNSTSIKIITIGNSGRTFFKLLTVDHRNFTIR